PGGIENVAAAACGASVVFALPVGTRFHPEIEAVVAMQLGECRDEGMRVHESRLTDVDGGEVAVDVEHREFPLIGPDQAVQTLREAERSEIKAPSVERKGLAGEAGVAIAEVEYQR